MTDPRDRLLGTLFAVQLLAALVFGGVVASWLLSDGGATAHTVPAAAAAAAGGDTDAAAASTSTAASATPGAGTGAAPADGGTGTATTAGDASGDTATVATGAASGTTTAAAPAVDPAAAEGDRTGITDTTIRIGSLVTQTGAINFRSSAQGTKAYVDMVNEQGGVHGRRIELLLRDDGLDVNKGQQAVQDMINRGIFALVALNAPLTEQSLVPVVEKHALPVSGAFSMSTSPLSYRFGAGYQNFGKVGGKFLCEQGVQTPGLVYISNQNEELDGIIEQAWRLGLATCGLELDADNTHGVDVTKADFSDVVTQLRFRGVDAIGTILDASAMLRLQQSMNRQAFAPLHISSPFGADPAVVRDPNVGGSFEGMYVLSDVGFLGGPAPEVRTYEQEVRRRFGDDAQLNWAGEMGWLGAHVFVETLRALGPDPTREAFLTTLSNTEELETGMTPPLTFTPFTQDEGGHAPNTCLQVGRVSSGAVRSVRDYECTTYDMTRF